MCLHDGEIAVKAARARLDIHHHKIRRLSDMLTATDRRSRTHAADIAGSSRCSAGADGWDVLSAAIVCIVGNRPPVGCRKAAGSIGLW